MNVESPLAEMSVEEKLLAMHALWADLSRSAPEKALPDWHLRILESSRRKLAMPMACVHLAPMKITLEFEEQAFASLRRGPEEFARELRLAACVKWYELGQISQACRT